MRAAPITSAGRASTSAAILSFALALLVGSACSHGAAAGTATAGERPRVIIFVWDGLRPDAITRAETPNLYALREEGVEFSDHHATYPTFTMVNAASLATGS